MENNIQQALFCESFNEALREIVKALGGNKKVGPMLRPQKSATDAQSWLADCLNPDRREKLDPDEVAFLLREARKINCHVAMNYLADDAGYAHPTPVEPEDEKAKLMRDFIEATKQQTRNVARMEQIASTQMRA